MKKTSFALGARFVKEFFIPRAFFSMDYISAYPSIMRKDSA